ncbi:ABC transporter ATP-binding protein [Pseudodonghicola flavimaris]|uniref:ABC transporter ATP-binding protein n=1 Tax=Pseudodonghicola flavimaris TaxID=3050036 RepID=A0ABT7F568_9RHOB|nr:ABC transporter ATP-binding protein [Pseudodonghicola flavimaris]MDK3019756.1 ABC transporter ATP-binding protein [Pseudodonghicola flavimaris]
MTTLLEIRDLRLQYGQFKALHGLDVEIAEGEIVAVIGANGAGKSSLIKGICCTEGQTSGSVKLDGRELLGLTPPQIARAGIGLVPEGRRIFPSLSVEENILLGGQLGQDHGGTPWTLERIYELFPDLTAKRHLSGTMLSGGQQQMIAIGRALMTNPRVLLCDEISLGLAPTIINRLYEQLIALASEGLAVLVVEQAMRKALEISDRYYCILEGRVSLSGISADADEDRIAQAYFGR